VTAATNWRDLKTEASRARFGGDYERAAELLAEAIRAAGPGAEVADDVALMMNSRADLLQRQGRLAEAIGVARAGVELRRRTLPPDRPILLGSDLMFLATVLEEHGDLDGAEAAAREGVSIYEDVFGPEYAEVGRMRAILQRIAGQRSAPPAPPGDV
jgi:tetratricopeptide (TPR) repeat protein